MSCVNHLAFPKLENVEEPPLKFLFFVAKHSVFLLKYLYILNEDITFRGYSVHFSITWLSHMWFEIVLCTACERVNAQYVPGPRISNPQVIIRLALWETVILLYFILEWFKSQRASEFKDRSKSSQPYAASTSRIHSWASWLLQDCLVQS